ncbi:MAG: putative PurR-regulated permease PerM [Janthinobacterium sp.]|jgi:predicted PurR-regulated permease PerM
MPIAEKFDHCRIASYIMMALFLLMVLVKGLLGALFAGLLVYSLIHLTTPLLARHISGARARMLAAAAIGTLLIAVLTLAIWGAVVFFKGDASSLTNLFKKMADIIETSRSQIPPWIDARLPVDADGVRTMMTQWLREHADEAKIVGAEAGKTVAHVLIGMILGVTVSLHDILNPRQHRPLAAELLQRTAHLSVAFRNIVFAQVWISGINTFITAIFILLILPAAGITLPLSKTLIAITFFAGLLPVIGNLISNTVLVTVALSHSLHTALGALAFMVVLHKLEYFLNARIIGARINACAWELLIAMLVAESLFGLPGLIAAPVFYAYAKRELMARELI